MDQEERKMLEQALQLARDNNRMLKDQQAARRRSALFKLIYWLAVVTVAVVIYYYVHPFLMQLLDVYTLSSEMMDEFSDFRSLMPGR